ncbi:MAG: flippase [Armatimonadota bacterium]|nr:flippase [Armatimonadota bacterium]
MPVSALGVSARAVAWNTGIQFIGRIVTTLTQALLVMVLARAFVHHLGPVDGVREMGRYTTIMTFAVVFETFARFGFFATLVKEFSEREDQATEILARALPLRLLLAGVVAVAGTGLALVLRFEPVVTIGVALLAVSTCWGAVFNTAMAYFQSRHLMVYPVAAEALGRLVALLGMTVAALAGAPLLVVIACSLLGSLVMAGVCVGFLRRFEPLGWCVDRTYWHALVAQAVPVGLIAVLSLAYGKASVILLAAMRGSFDVGVYGVAFKLTDVLVAFPAVLVGNLFPVLARALDRRDRADAVVRRTVGALAACAFPVVVGAFVLAAPLVRLTGGETYLAASAVSVFGTPVTAVHALRVLVWAVLAGGFAHLGLSLVILRGLQARYLRVVAIVTLGSVAASYVLIPRYSYAGVSVVTVLTEVLMVATGWWMLTRSAEMRLAVVDVWKPGVAAATMGAVVWPVQALPLWAAVGVGVPLGALVYVALLSALGGLPVESLRGAIRRRPEPVA